MSVATQARIVSAPPVPAIRQPNAAWLDFIIRASSAADWALIEQVEAGDLSPAEAMRQRHA